MTKKKKFISKKKSVRSGNARRLITTTRRQEIGKKRNLTFISFKEKNTQICAQDQSYRGRLEQVHIAVLRIGPQKLTSVEGPVT